MDSSVVDDANLAPLHSFMNRYTESWSSIIARWMPRQAVVGVIVSMDRKWSGVEWIAAGKVGRPGGR